MSKQRHDDPVKNLEAFLNDEGIDLSPADKDEMVNLLKGTDDAGLLPDNVGFFSGAMNIYEQITGNRWKDMIPMIALLILGLSCILYWNLPKTDTVIVWQDLEYTTTAEQGKALADNENSNDKNAALPIRTQPERDPGYHRQVVPITDSVLHSEEQLANNDILNYYKKDPVMLLDKITLPEKLGSSMNNQLIIHRDMKLDNSLTNSNNNLGWLFKYELYKTDNLDDKLTGSNNSINTAFDNSNHLIANGSRNCNTGNYPVQLDEYYEKLKFALDTSELIKIKDKKLLEKRILLINTYVQEYTKTKVHVEKDKILFLSCHGTISSPDCNLTFGPEGLNIIPESSDCGRLIKNYPLGALLFRLNDQEDWKIYSTSQTRIVAEKDGILEFTINYKVQKKNTLSGKFAVSVFTNQ